MTSKTVTPNYATQVNDPTNPDHYNKYPIQPRDYVMMNSLGYCEGTIIKYVTRWKDKGGAEDLRKARNFLDYLIDWAEENGYST